MIISRHTIEYMAWFKRELVDGILCDKTTGELVYLFGQEFLNATDFENPAVLQQFGLKSVWFARYFKCKAKLPTIEGGHRTIEKSQIRIKVDLLPDTVVTPSWHDALKTYLLEQLGFTAEQIDEVKIDTEDTCCHSPCYGCTRFDVDKAIEKQGEQPFLMAIKAGIDTHTHHGPVVN
ncbi:MAG: hypothetical protein NTW61_06245 [Candidatus Melainabacteria bacterium]|jgi:hypothetical protein|nr:hypothetical protein [Candidatus Melainabacteria bacterium]